MTQKKKQILKLLHAIRLSYPDASIIYRFGACYGLYEVFKSVFDDAIPYMTKDESHIVTRIDDDYYDISGEYLNSKGELREECVKLDEQQKRYWETVSGGQRVEYMLKKYNE